jgi:hypothetical protein
METALNPARSRQKGRGHHLGLVLVCVLVLPLTIALGPSPLHSSSAVPEGKVTVQEAYGKSPLHFEANQGQTASQVKFLSRGPGYTLFLTPTEAVLTLKQAKGKDSLRATRHALREHDLTALRMKIEGANPSPRATGLEPLPGIVNYFIGDDPAQWRTNVTTYAKVRYDGLYPGVDLIYYGTQRQLEYDFVVRPGADPSSIALSFQGADRLEVDAQGDLVLHTAAGAIRMRKPVIYQEGGGVRKEISGGYVLMGEHLVGFQVAAYDASRPLIIDPVLSYSTYLGGSGFDDQGLGIAVDAAGNAYVTGFTDSLDFPTTAGAFQPTLGGFGFNDAFVMKFNPTGSALVYSTYLGGRGGDEGLGIAVDAAGNAYVTGDTGSTDFPTTAGAFQPGGPGAFVTKLDPTGGALVYSTYLGGSDFDQGTGIAVDAAGNAYVTGGTSSTDFPTTAGAFQTTFGGGLGFPDAFVTKLNASGTALVYSTYLGGGGIDRGFGIAVDAAGNAYVTGFSDSLDFPTTAGAFQVTFGGGGDAFVTKLNPTGAALVTSTYLGGSGADAGRGIAVDAAGNAYVTGETDSRDFPTTGGAFQPTFDGPDFDAFVTKLNPTGAALVYSTYLGGSEFDVTQGIAVDAAGNAYVTGETSSRDFPTTAGAFQMTIGGVSDAFVTKLTATGAALVYSTYLGGGDIDRGFGIAVDAAGNAYVTGGTTSIDFPTTAGAFQSTFGGGFGDGFVAKITDGVLDTTPPMTTALPSPMPNAAGWNSGDVMVTLSATDTDSGVLQITYSASGAQVIASTTVSGATTSVLITAEGETTITFFAEDNAGNQETPTTVIVRIDHTPPTITAPPNITVVAGPGATLCSAVVLDATLGMATASDNSGITTVSRGGVPAGNVFPMGTTFVTYTGTDSVGHETTATQMVTVNDTTAPVLSTPPGVTVNATSPAGAVVTYALPGATDNCPAVSVAGAPPSGSTFAIGTTTVMVTATDAAGNTSNKMFQVTVVVGAAGQTTNLSTLVLSFGLQHGIETSLLSKLRSALDAINAGNVRIACSLLDSFMHEVQAQSGKKITAAQAAQLIAAATQIKAVLGCP